MKHNLIFIFLFFFTASFFISAEAAQAQYYDDEEGFFAIGVKAGTLGGGIEGIFKLTDHFDFRAGGNYFKFDYDGDISDIEYENEIELMNYAALFDWYPSKSCFRITAGLIVNESEIDFSSASANTFTINNTAYTAAEVGTLNGEFDFMEFSPYLGIGWGRPFGKQSNWTISIDLGAMYIGETDVNLTSNGSLANNAAFQANLENEREDIEDEISKYQVYPVVSIGITYKF